MSKSFGLVLAGIGVSIAAYVLIQPDPLSHLTTALQPGPSKPAPPPDSSSKPALWVASTAPEAAFLAPISVESKPAPPRRVNLADLPQRIAVTREPDDTRSSSDKLQLARDIQRNLKRVGCYTGDVSGEWSPATRRAMKSYLDDVNASLPVDQPQIALLALLESQALPACGAPCGPNALRAGDGRCRSTPATSREVQAADGGVFTPPLDGQMSLAGPGASEKLGSDSALISAAPASEPPAHRAPKRAQAPKKFGHPAWAFSYNPN